MKLIVPDFGEDKDQLFDFLRKNKSALYASKIAELKFADSISYSSHILDPKDNVYKATDVGATDLMSKEMIQGKLAINSTNLLDTHKDVHIPGLWKKTLKEGGKRLLLLQEHKMGFATIIADAKHGEIKGYTELMKWKDLGFDYKGETEVLLFDAQIKKNRNPFMFEQYAKAYVDEHSVGMGYVMGKYLLCVNSEEKYWIEEKDRWDEYVEQVVNKEAAEETGYFWAVLEGKAVEGSAVPRGSNHATPTLDMKSEPGKPLDKKPDESTSKKINYNYLIKNL